MTPVQIAKEHCANYDTRDGSCLGVYYNDDLSIRFKRPFAKCLLNQPCQKCYYFEEIVMGILIEDRDKRAEGRKQSEFKEGVDQYIKAVYPPEANVSDERRRCPKCKTQFLKKRERYCAECKELNRKETLRRANLGRK